LASERTTGSAQNGRVVATNSGVVVVVGNVEEVVAVVDVVVDRDAVVVVTVVERVVVVVVVVVLVDVVVLVRTPFGPTNVTDVNETPPVNGVSRGVEPRMNRLLISP